jgi:hypothetical protein
LRWSRSSVVLMSEPSSSLLIGTSADAATQATKPGRCQVQEELVRRR